MVETARSGSCSSWRLARPRSMVRRTRRCWGPSWMSRSSRRSDSASAWRAASRPTSTRATSSWSSARLLSRAIARLECRTAAKRTTHGSVTSRAAPMVRLSRLSATRPSPSPSSSARPVSSSLKGMKRCQNQYVRPPTAPVHHTRVSTNATRPVTKPAIVQTTSSHDCGSRSGVSIRLQKPVVGPGAQVARARHLAAQHGPDPVALEPGEAARDVDAERQQQHAADDDQQAHPGREQDDGQDEAGQVDREGRERVAAVEQHPLEPARRVRRHRSGGGRVVAHVQGLRHGYDARYLAPPARSCQPDSRCRAARPP